MNDMGELEKLKYEVRKLAERIDKALEQPKPKWAKWKGIYFGGLVTKDTWYKVHNGTHFFANDGNETALEAWGTLSVWTLSYSDTCPEDEPLCTKCHKPKNDPIHTEYGKGGGYCCHSFRTLGFEDEPVCQCGHKVSEHTGKGWGTHPFGCERQGCYCHLPKPISEELPRCPRCGGEFEYREVVRGVWDFYCVNIESAKKCRLAFGRFPSKEAAIQAARRMAKALEGCRDW